MMSYFVSATESLSLMYKQVNCVQKTSTIVLEG